MIRRGNRSVTAETAERGCLSRSSHEANSGSKPVSGHFAVGSAAAETAALVRLKGCWVEAVRVRFCAVKNRAVSNRNCVVETRGGEQRNENSRSVRVHRKRPYSSHLRALLHCHAFTSTLNGVCQTSTTKSVF